MARATDLNRQQAWLLNAIRASKPPSDAGAHIVAGPLAVPRRLGIYAHAYRERLRLCLASEFVAIQRILGDELFDTFCLAYVEAQPPSPYSLSNLGEGFPHFLEAQRPDRAARTPDPAYNRIVDLARVERRHAEVFRGPGIEGARHPELDELLATPESSRVVLAPSIAFVRARTPVVAQFLAARAGEAIPPFSGAGPQWVILSRNNYVVEVRAVARWEWALFAELSTGARLGAAFDAAAARHPEPAPAARGAARAALAIASERGMIAAIGADER